IAQRAMLRRVRRGRAAHEAPRELALKVFAGLPIRSRMFSLMESALDALGADDMLDEATLAIREADLHRRTGRVVDLIGLITEATGLEAEVGEVCTIETGRGRASVPAEVVGFRAGRTLLMALGDATGIGPGAKVVASGQPLKVDVSDALLGRALDGL